MLDILLYIYRYYLILFYYRYLFALNWRRDYFHEFRFDGFSEVIYAMLGKEY